MIDLEIINYMLYSYKCFCALFFNLKTKKTSLLLKFGSIQ